MSLWTRTSAVIALGAGVALLLPSCGGFGSVCKAEMNCRGGNSNDVDACEDRYKGQENIASDAKCSGQWSDYWSCIEDHATCRAPGTFDDNGFCNPFQKALSDCEQPLGGI
jgi:hypothetical protein